MTGRHLLSTFALVLLAGCVSGGGAEGQRRPVPTDACAERLHGISGKILEHYAARRRWPRTAAELVAAGVKAESLVCPISGKAYIFEEAALESPLLRGRILLHDAPGAHSSYGWGIVVRPAQAGQPVSAQVIVLAPGDAAPH